MSRIYFCGGAERWAVSQCSFQILLISPYYLNKGPSLFFLVWAKPPGGENTMGI